MRPKALNSGGAEICVAQPLRVTMNSEMRGWVIGGCASGLFHGLLALAVLNGPIDDRPQPRRGADRTKITLISVTPKTDVDRVRPPRVPKKQPRPRRPRARKPAIRRPAAKSSAPDGPTSSKRATPPPSHSGSLPSIRILPPTPELVVGPPTVTGRDRSLGTGVDELKSTGAGHYEARQGPAVGRIAPDGSIRFDDPSAAETAAAIGLGLVQLNPLPLINTIVGEDSRTADKLAIMEKTAELRQQMKDAATRERLKRSLNELRFRLEMIWNETEVEVRERRRSLFGVWDDCAEDGNTAILGASRAARKIIVEFINEQLPVGSAHAFAESELAELNRGRRSRARFDPYRARSRAPGRALQ